MRKKVKFIDIFAGLGGIRLGFENALKSMDIDSECVLTSEIKKYATETLRHNFGGEVSGNIIDIPSEEIPDFDFLLAGFPCQPFSTAGNRKGFQDTRGTLFFEIERILRDKEPSGFILENVEGLVNHDKGKTLNTILHTLTNLGYNTTYKVLNASEFGLAQTRKRIFITGLKNDTIDLNNHEIKKSILGDILESGLPTMDTYFTGKILTHYNISDLAGKAINDKRGGNNNIHSWDIALKGTISEEQRVIMNRLFKERRRRSYAEETGVKWSDGMPLTLQQISTFAPFENLETLLNDLTKKGYLSLEYPRDEKRNFDTTKPLGYNIVSGQLSFDISKILDPNGITPTLVATDMSKMAVIDGSGLRRLTIREGLRLFGFPENYNIIASDTEAFDLLGNSVAVPVVEFVSQRVLAAFFEK